MQSLHISAVRILALSATISVFCIALPGPVAAVQGGKSPSVEMALSMEPLQKDSVDYSVPSKKEMEQCKVRKAETIGQSGWILLDPAGRLLRRFVDTDKDSEIDQWCYYKDGIEVYRDIDTDGDSNAETFAWMGVAGIRKGVDSDGDFEIDRWMRISAEEVTAEIVRALRENNPKRFQALLPTEKEIDELGLGKQMTDEVREHVAEARKQFAKSGGKVLGKDSKWIHFGGTRPTLVPSDLMGSTKDVIAYENVVALVQDSGKPAQLAIGSLIRVGDGWRTLDMPEKIEAEKAPTVGGFFLEQMMAAVPDSGQESTGVDKEMQQLVASYQRLEDQLRGPDASKLSKKEAARLSSELAGVMEKMFDKAENGSEKATWAEQLVQTIADSMASGNFPDGDKRIEKFLIRAEKDETLSTKEFGDVKYRWMNILRSQQVADPEADTVKVQAQWKENLEKFVRNYADSDSAAEAMLELGLQAEFEAANETSKKKRAVLDEKAEAWYQKIVKDHPDLSVSKKAAGAVRRINSEGRPLQMEGLTSDGRKLSLADADGKIVVLHYWATYCKSCLEEMETIAKLQEKFGKRGFQPIGINVDSDKKVLLKYLAKNKLKWPQLFVEGGVDGELATELGVQIVPTMLLIDRDGKVVNRRVNGSDLEDEVKDLLLKSK